MFYSLIHRPPLESLGYLVRHSFVVVYVLTLETGLIRDIKSNPIAAKIEDLNKQVFHSVD